jgi:hypothetical protein
MPGVHRWVIIIGKRRASRRSHAHRGDLTLRGKQAGVPLTVTEPPGLLCRGPDATGCLHFRVTTDCSRAWLMDHPGAEVRRRRLRLMRSPGNVWCCCRSDRGLLSRVSLLTRG